MRERDLDMAFDEHDRYPVPTITEVRLVANMSDGTICRVHKRPEGLSALEKVWDNGACVRIIVPVLVDELCASLPAPDVTGSEAVARIES